MNAFRHSSAGQDPATKLMLLAFVFIAAAAWHTRSSAAELGRLFFTPQQRLQLDQGVSTSGVAASNRGYIMVNGVVQKQGGNRMVWINGQRQAAGLSNDKTPASVPLNVPGKSQPVKAKVGQRILLDTPAQETGQ